MECRNPFLIRSNYKTYSSRKYTLIADFCRNPFLIRSNYKTLVGEVHSQQRWGESQSLLNQV